MFLNKLLGNQYASQVNSIKTITCGSGGAPYRQSVK